MKKAKMAEKILPEWSHKVAAEGIGATPLRTSISASPQQRKDLARRLGVKSIESTEAVLTLVRDPNMVIHISGELKARVVQPCVVTLEPVTQDIQSSVEGWFANPDRVVSIAKARHERQSRSADAELPILEEKDDPEPIVDGEIDLGELATQFLSLSIDPYPHKEGVAFERQEDAAGGGKASETRRNPFAALKNWKKAENKDN